MIKYINRIQARQTYKLLINFWRQKNDEEFGMKNEEKSYLCFTNTWFQFFINISNNITR